LKKTKTYLTLLLLSVCILSIAYPQITFVAGNGAGSGGGGEKPPKSSTTTSYSVTTTTTAIQQHPSQVSLNVSYRVVAGGNASGPWFTFSENGVSRNVTLALSPTTYVVDSGTDWHVASVLFGHSTSERWSLSAENVTSQSATMNATLAFVYDDHQFLLTLLVDPPGSGTTVSSISVGEQNWANADSNVIIRAIASSYLTFSSWSCEGAGCYSGSDNPAEVTMNSPIAETAHFEQAANVMIKSQGGAQFIVVDNRTIGINDATPYVPDWVVSSTHIIVALSNASCGFRLGPFSGCAYVFKEWIVNGTTKTTDTINVNVTGKPTTIVGVWTQSYLNLEIALSLAIVVTIATLFLMRKKPSGPSVQRGQPLGLLHRYGSLSDVGKVRKNNEDSILAVEWVASFGSKPSSVLLCAVADGVGGARKGEVASALTLQTVIAETSLQIVGSGTELGGVLRTAIEAANEAVVKYGMDHRESEGLSTTIVATIISGKTAHVAHAGDSRAYLINRGGIKQLTKDDSEVQELVDAGKITADEARRYPGRNVITRAVGAASDIRVNVTSIELQPGDRILLCSDGLWEPVSKEDLHKIVLQSANPQLACNQLVSMANQRGGGDNISVIIVEMQSLMEK